MFRLLISPDLSWDSGKIDESVGEASRPGSVCAVRASSVISDQILRLEKTHGIAALAGTSR